MRLRDPEAAAEIPLDAMIDQHPGSGGAPTSYGAPRAYSVRRAQRRDCVPLRRPCAQRRDYVPLRPPSAFFVRRARAQGSVPQRRPRALAISILVCALALSIVACSARTTSGSGTDTTSGSATLGLAGTTGDTGATGASTARSQADIAPQSSADLGDAGPPDDAGTLPGKTEGCPEGMLLVEGDYCPDVLQKCLGHSKEYDKDKALEARKKASGEAIGKSNVSERCLRYEAPSVCLSKQRRHVRFCIDRYEWPNKQGELPALLVSWVDAKKECEAIGKRLCTEDEFNFACEGEEMLPYTYGYERDPSKCNIDKPYRKREKKLSKYARCMQDPVCKAELEKLDQRLPAGSLPACVSPFGVYDLNGNINEWVFRPKEKPPSRSGLKGGWWGPVRGRCRPTVGFHKEEDYGYEEGFRCCASAAAPPAATEAP